MSLRSILLLLLLVGCREVAPPVAPPRPGPTAEAADAPPEERKTQLAHAFPAEVVLFTETTPGAPGLPMAEAALRVLLGDVPETQAILDATEVLASAMVDLSTMSGATVLRLRDDEPLRAWARALNLSSEGGDVERFSVSAPFGLAWWGERRLLVLGVADMVELTISTLRRERTSLAEAQGGELAAAEGAGTVMYLALPKLQPSFTEPLLATIGAADDPSAIHARTASKPLLSGLSLEPIAVDLAEVLPEEAVVYVATGVPKGAVEGLPAALATLTDKIDALAAAILITPDLRLTEHAPTERAAAMLLVRLREGKTLGDDERRRLESELGPGEATVTVSGRHALVVVGAPKLAQRAIEALGGKGTLAASGRYRPVALSGSQLQVWADAERIVTAMSKMVDPNALKLFGDGAMKPTSLAVRAGFGDDRWTYELAGTEVVSAAMVMGAGAAVIKHAVAQYIAAAKVAEATNTVRAIARAAAAAHAQQKKLCATSSPVPAEVPRGTTHAASTDPGADYQKGDARTGWPCLKFSITAPQRYRYQYLVGGPGVKSRIDDSPLSAGRFEVVAEGDLDGDGKTSLFVLSGRIDGGEVAIADELFVKNELE